MTNRLNQKKYVGRTTLLLEKRWKQHVAASNSDSELHFHRAIRKHGESEFDICVIESCDDEQSGEREKFWIAHHRSFPDGYNMTVGGDGVIGRKHTPEARAKISKNLRGRIVSEQTREKIRQTRLGKRQTAEAREKVRLAVHDRLAKADFREHHRKACQEKLASLSPAERKKRGAGHRKAIVQKTLDGKIVARFASISDAALAVGVTLTAISAVLNRGAKQCRGFRWEFDHEETETAKA